MSAFNLKSKIIQTILGKGTILLLNFAVTILTTRFWHAEGRGAIAIFVANLSLIAIVTNIFTGSSVSYFLSKYRLNKLLLQAYLWVFLVSTALGIFFHLTDREFPALLLFLVATLMGLFTFHTSVFVGTQKIAHYNLVMLLQPLLLLVFMLLFYYWVVDTYFAYFYGQIVASALVFALSKILTRKQNGREVYQLDKQVVKETFRFGWQIELSSFLQFFNYRLSFYFLNYFLGAASVGVFSIGVTLSEAIWVISKSISLVQYSNVVKQGNTAESRKETVTTSKYSLFITLLFLLIALCIPDSVYAFVFGKEFTGIREIILWLSPGILALAVSNVYGNYFSAIGKAPILILKSAVGVVITLALSFLLIPSLQIKGACIVNSGSYIVSSIILLVYFFFGNHFRNQTKKHLPVENEQDVQ